MGIAALILGIIAIITAFIPGCGIFIAPLLGLIGLILGIVDTVQKSKKGEKKGASIAGIVLSAISFIVIVLQIVVFGALISNIDPNEIESSISAWNEIYSNYDFSDYD